MKTKAIVLLSGGLDSATALSAAIKDYDVVLALTFNYGQRAAKKELRAAKKLAKHYSVPHTAIRLNWFKNIIHTALVDTKKNIPALTKASQGNNATAAAVWVPNRNGLFLNIAASFAESLGAKIIVTGFNAEEAVTFPDNSLDFCKASEKAFSFSTLNKVKIKNYFYKHNKQKILTIAKKNKVPLKYIWSCYYGGWQPCGHCESCIRFKEAATK